MNNLESCKIESHLFIPLTLDPAEYANRCSISYDTLYTLAYSKNLGYMECCDGKFSLSDLKR